MVLKVHVKTQEEKGVKSTNGFNLLTQYLFHSSHWALNEVTAEVTRITEKLFLMF